MPHRAVDYTPLVIEFAHRQCTLSNQSNTKNSKSWPPYFFKPFALIATVNGIFNATENLDTGILCNFNSYYVLLPSIIQANVLEWQNIINVLNIILGLLILSDRIYTAEIIRSNRMVTFQT